MWRFNVEVQCGGSMWRFNVEVQFGDLGNKLLQYMRAGRQVVSVKASDDQSLFAVGLTTGPARSHRRSRSQE